MPPPTSSRSTCCSRLSMTPSLSETLEPPSTTTYGRSGSSVSRRSTSTSAATRPPAACGSRPRDVVDAGLLAVHDAEAVGDEGVGEPGELRRRRRRARRRPCWSRPGRTGGSPAARRRRRRARRRRPARELARRCRWRTRPAGRAARRAASATGRSEYLVLRRALRAAEVGAHDDPCARVGAGAGWSAPTARIRPSSVIVPSPSSGTLRSQRTRTRLPRRSPRCVDRSSCQRPALRARRRRSVTRSTRRLE